MLQLVIWLLCVYLVVKGFEILSDPAQRNSFGHFGVALAWIAAPVFFVLSIGQAESMNDNPFAGGLSGFDTPARISDPTTGGAAVSTNEALESADEAIREADAALENAAKALE